MSTFTFTNRTDATKFARAQGGPVVVDIENPARGEWLVTITSAATTPAPVVTIAEPIAAFRADFEQASSIETHTIVPGDYPVRFVTVNGRDTDEASAYYAQVVVNIEDVRYAYKYEAPRPQPNGTRTLCLYGYEWKAGKGFYTATQGGGGVTIR